MISLLISRKEIDGHKVPSTYTTNFALLHSKSTGQKILVSPHVMFQSFKNFKGHFGNLKTGILFFFIYPTIIYLFLFYLFYFIFRP